MFSFPPSFQRRILFANVPANVLLIQFFQVSIASGLAWLPVLALSLLSRIKRSRAVYNVYKGGVSCWGWNLQKSPNPAMKDISISAGRGLCLKY